MILVMKGTQVSRETKESLVTKVQQVPMALKVHRVPKDKQQSEMAGTREIKYVIMIVFINFENSY